MGLFRIPFRRRNKPRAPSISGALLDGPLLVHHDSSNPTFLLALAFQATQIEVEENHGTHS